jgi:hypothetical protein
MDRAGDNGAVVLVRFGAKMTAFLFGFGRE